MKYIEIYFITDLKYWGIGINASYFEVSKNVLISLEFLCFSFSIMIGKQFYY